MAPRSQSTAADQADPPGWPLFTNQPVAANPNSPPSGLKPDWSRWHHGQRWPEAPAWRQFLAFTQDQAESRAALEQLEKEEEDYWQGCNTWHAAHPGMRPIARDQHRGRSIVLPRQADGALSDAASRVLLGVNAAIQLRRPLLVTGPPGVGKSSLAHAIAVELGLGSVLTWPVTPRSQLLDGGLFLYDAVGRLQDSNLVNATAEPKQSPPTGEYLTLGPVGTAFLPFRLPRVLLIDEIDKGDLQLPHELLHLFEEGAYEIPQLVREARRAAPAADAALVSTADPGGRWPVLAGRVQCRQFPIIVLTSNGERDFPPAFHRRCIRIEMPQPDRTALKQVVEQHFGPLGSAGESSQLEREIEAFLAGDGQPDRATDQLLNAWHLLRPAATSPPNEADRQQLRAILHRRLSD